MRKIATFLGMMFALLVSSSLVLGQNYIPVTGSKLLDFGGQPLANGSICFVATDSSDNPLQGVNVGGSSQAFNRAPGECGSVTAGVITGPTSGTGTFQIVNPSAATPAGFLYRITVNDLDAGVPVSVYKEVLIVGSAFDFDNFVANPTAYACTNCSWNAAATIAIGTTSTVANGVPASVTNSGTSSQAVLNFVIPAGPQGPPGILNIAGVWQPSHGYTASQAYEYNGYLYIVLTSYTSGTSFGSTDISNTFGMALGMPTTGGSFTGQITAPAVNNVVSACNESGATADVQINAALASSYTTVDARCYGSSTQTISSTVTVGKTIIFDQNTTFQPGSSSVNMFQLGQQANVQNLTINASNQANYSGDAVSNAPGQQITAWSLSHTLVTLPSASTGNCLALRGTSPSASIIFTETTDFNCHAGPNSNGILLAVTNNGWVNGNHFYGVKVWDAKYGFNLSLSGTFSSGAQISGNTVKSYDYEGDGLSTSLAAFYIGPRTGTAQALDNVFDLNAWDIPSGNNSILIASDPTIACGNDFKGMVRYNNISDGSSCAQANTWFDTLYGIQSTIRPFAVRAGVNAEAMLAGDGQSAYVGSINAAGGLYFQAGNQNPWWILPTGHFYDRGAHNFYAGGWVQGVGGVKAGANAEAYLGGDGTNAYVGSIASGGALFFQANNTIPWYIHQAGSFFPKVDNTYDVGSTSLRPAHVYGNNGIFNNLTVVNCPSGQFPTGDGTGTCADLQTEVTNALNTANQALVLAEGGTSTTPGGGSTTENVLLTGIISSGNSDTVATGGTVSAPSSKQMGNCATGANGGTLLPNEPDGQLYCTAAAQACGEHNTGSACPSGNTGGGPTEGYVAATTSGGNVAAFTNGNDSGGSLSPTAVTDEYGLTTYDSVCSASSFSTLCVSGGTELIAQTSPSSGSGGTDTIYPTAFNNAPCNTATGMERIIIWQVPSNWDSHMNMEHDTNCTSNDTLTGSYHTYHGLSFQYNGSKQMWQYNGQASSQDASECASGGGWCVINLTPQGGGTTLTTFPLTPGEWVAEDIVMSIGGPSCTNNSTAACDVWQTMTIQTSTDGSTWTTPNTYNIINPKTGTSPAVIPWKENWQASQLVGQTQLDDSTDGRTYTLNIALDAVKLFTTSTTGGGGTTASETVGDDGEFDWTSSTTPSGLTLTGTAPTFNTTTYFNAPGSPEFTAASSYYSAPWACGTTCVFRGYLYIDASTTSGVQVVNFNGASGAAVANLYFNATYGYLTFYDNATSTSYTCQTSALAAGWHLIEAKLVIGTGTSGSATVHVDSTATSCNGTGINTGSTPVTTVEFGETSAPASPWSLEWDYVGLSDGTQNTSNSGFLGPVTFSSGGGTGGGTSTSRPIGIVVDFNSPYSTSLTLPLYTIPSGNITTIAFAANCSGSTFTGTASATVNTTFTVTHDGTTICVGTISAGGSSLVWSTSYSASTFVAGDSLAVTYSGDATLAGSLQLNATRTN